MTSAHDSSARAGASPPGLPATSPVGAFVERAARLAPDRPAVIQGGATLSYAALDAAANRLAHRLLESGVKGDRVAHLMPDSPQVFVALLAALKAGRINHVLNHRDPLPRLEELVADSEPEAIVTAAPHVELATRLAGDRARVIRLDMPLGELPGTSPSVPIAPGDGAYLVYTSGSTGKPKAVLLAHGDIVRSALALAERLAITASDRVALLSALWGNQAIGTTFATLFAGATLLPFPVVDFGIAGLAPWMEREQVTVYASAASLLRALLATLEADVRFPTVRIVKASADAATADDFRALRRHLPNADLFSSMGSSEIGTIAGTIIDRHAPPASGRLPIGVPMPGLAIRIVDDLGRDVAAGETGRLLIRSDAMFARYWRDDALTEARYHEFGNGMREFRSEDSVRLDRDGNLVHAGRRDAAYKIRGQRVDLAEVDRLLQKLPGVTEAAAAVVAGRDGGDRLVAHVVLADGNANEQHFRAMARAHMPRHMIPSTIVFVQNLPRAANGKVDRVRLRSSTVPPGPRGAPPATDTERQLARFFEEALDLDEVGREDDFFGLGGDSLSAATVAIRIEEARGIRLPFAAFVEYSVLADMAKAIDDARFAHEGARLGPMPRGAEAPTSLLQEPFWRVSRAPAHAWRYTRAAAISLDGPLDRDALEAAVGAVVARHEILRTRYRADPEGVVQIIEPPAPVVLPFTDLGDTPDADAEIGRLLAEEGQRTFDLAAAPPLSFKLFRLSPDRHVLLRAAHHILDDAPSWNIFARDLGACYTAAIEGGSPDLPDLPIQYADFAIWQRREWRSGGDRLERAVTWFSEKLAAEPRPAIVRTMPGYLRRVPAADGMARSFTKWGVDSATAAALGRLARTEIATFYAVRLACLSAVASRMTGQPAVVLGGIFTNRGSAAVEHMIGPFANLVPLVIRCDPDATFRDHVRRVMVEVTDAHRYADMPLAALHHELAAHGVEMPAPFLWIHVPTPSPPVIAGGLSIHQRAAPYVGASGIVMVRFNPLDEERESTISVDPRLYAPELLDDLAARLRAFAGAAARRPEMTLSELAAATEDAVPRRGPETATRTTPGSPRPAA